MSSDNVANVLKRRRASCGIPANPPNAGIISTNTFIFFYPRADTGVCPYNLAFFRRGRHRGLPFFICYLIIFRWNQASCIHLAHYAILPTFETLTMLNEATDSSLRIAE